MSSEFRRARIFHRYHQAQQLRENNRYHGDIDKGCLSRTTRTTLLSPTKPTAPHAKSTGRIRSVPLSMNDTIVGDLALGHPPSPHNHIEIGRNPTEYKLTPSSARAFRIVSLDGCYEEQVSPLFTDTSASSLTNRIRNVPEIPALPSSVIIKRQCNTKKLSSTSSKKNSDAAGNVTTIPSGTNRRKSGHNRSQFVLDGNSCIRDLSPPSAYTYPPNQSYLSPQRASFPGILVMNNPPTIASISTSAMTPQPITPIITVTTPLWSNGSDHREDQPNRGRRTPPPTPEEQRRRNRALPSMQYENLVFNQLRREQFEENRQQLRRQYTW